MNKLILLLFLVVLAIILLLLPENKTDSLKKEWLKAARIAIKTEIYRMENQSIKKMLEKEFQRYSKMKPEEVKLPKPLVLRGKISNCEVGALILYDNMTRSGPFYHITPFKNCQKYINKTCRYKVYPVYPRIYPFPSYYVYVARVFCE
jgi:hypothetical protein